MRIELIHLKLQDFRQSLSWQVDARHSQLHENLYWNKFDEVGPHETLPCLYGLIVVDYLFSEAEEDLRLLPRLTKFAELSFCPVVISGTENFYKLLADRNDSEIAERLQNAVHAAESTGFVSVARPAAPPAKFYGDQNSSELDRTHPAYYVGIRVASEFDTKGWCVSISSGSMDPQKRGVCTDEKFKRPESELNFEAADCPNTLPKVIVISRLMQHLIGMAVALQSQHRHETCEQYLNRWLSDYVANPEHGDLEELAFLRPFGRAAVKLRFSDSKFYEQFIDAELELVTPKGDAPTRITAGIPRFRDLPQ